MSWGSSTITIPLQGGVGNQLFQLAAGLALSKRLNRHVTYSDHWLTHPALGETPRSLAIRWLLREDELVRAPAIRVGKITDRLVRSRVIERGPDDDALARVGRRTRSVAGYFHQLAYVDEAWPQLRERLASSEDPDQLALLNTTPGDFGALHYRLGDYVTNPDANRAHGVTAPEYFADIIRSGLQSDGITEWKVVSDDPGAAIELLRSTQLPAEVRLVTPERTDEWSDLAVLASASLCAISNSSFSWWAAYVGSSSRPTRVVAPRPWFSGMPMADPPLFPPGWERRDRLVLESTPHAHR